MEATVLIIDDDAAIRESLAFALEIRGYRVATACDGREGLHLARKYRPGVILLDLLMPDMDGFAFRDAQLQDPHIRDLPVLVCSAVADADVAARLGAAACLQKPIQANVLEESIAAVYAMLPCTHPQSPRMPTSSRARPRGGSCRSPSRRSGCRRRP